MVKKRTTPARGAAEKADAAANKALAEKYAAAAREREASGPSIDLPKEVLDTAWIKKKKKSEREAQAAAQATKYSTVDEIQRVRNEMAAGAQNRKGMEKARKEQIAQAAGTSQAKGATGAKAAADVDLVAVDIEKADELLGRLDIAEPMDSAVVGDDVLDIPDTRDEPLEEAN